MCVTWFAGTCGFLVSVRLRRSCCARSSFCRFPSVLNDSFIYGDIAKNWLLHGIYGLSGAGGNRSHLHSTAGLSSVSGVYFRDFRR